MSDDNFIQRELDHMPSKLVIPHRIKVPNAREAAARTRAWLKKRRIPVIVSKETATRYLVIPDGMDPVVYVTDRSITWEDVLAVEALK